MPAPISSRQRPDWVMRPLDVARSDLLERELGVLPLTARLLAVRDLPDAEAARAFLSPTLATLLDPFLMNGMDLAVERIAQAVRDHEPIAIYGDYDVDGLTATALLMRFFGALAPRSVPTFPTGSTKATA